MTDSTQLLGISNAVVDVLAHVDDEFLEKIGASPGSMTLIDEQRAQEVYSQMGPATEMSGGSVGNSIAGFANLGGRAAYIGRVADDQFGRLFVHDMTALGVDMRLPAETRAAPTACSYVLISPDGQRTMQTYLGACTEIETDDISSASVGTPDIVLLEGYIWDTPNGPAAVGKAMDIVDESGGTIAVSLSDELCVERHHDEFRTAVTERAGIVVANETEIIKLLDATDFDNAVAKAAALDVLFALTRSEQGSVIVHGDKRHVQPATPVERVVDTTGAGDAYTAGFLYGHAQQKTLADCAEIGSVCAAAVIQQIGARLEKGVLDGHR